MKKLYTLIATLFISCLAIPQESLVPLKISVPRVRWGFEVDALRLSLDGTSQTVYWTCNATAFTEAENYYIPYRSNSISSNKKTVHVSEYADGYIEYLIPPAAGKFLILRSSNYTPLNHGPLSIYYNNTLIVEDYWPVETNSWNLFHDTVFQIPEHLTLPAEAIIQPNILDFGAVPLSESKSLETVIKNVGEDELIVEEMRFSNSAYTCNSSFPIVLESNDSIAVKIGFTPRTDELANGTCTIMTNVGEFNVQLAGQGVCDFNMSTSNLSFTADGEIETFDIISNSDWSVSESYSWLSVLPSNGTKNQTLSVTASENSSSSERDGIITVTSCEGEQTISITQEASCLTTLSATNLNFDSNGGQKSLNVTSNSSWSVSESSLDWISISPTNGEGDGFLSISVQENLSTSERSGICQLSGCENIIEIEIVQSGRNLAPARLDYSLDEINFGSCSPGDSKTIQLKISNSGEQDLNVSVSIDENSNFVFANQDISLKSGDKVAIPIQFQPQYSGHKTGQLALSNNSEKPAVTLPVTGEGVYDKAYKDEIIKKLYEDLLFFYTDILRNEDTGMLLDSKLLSGVDYHPYSISCTGVGLIAECLADNITSQQHIIQTLKSLNGDTPGFHLEVNKNNIAVHWYDAFGNEMWGTQNYALIDISILLAGINVCRNKYPENVEIQKLATEYINSINLSNNVLANPADGSLYMLQDSEGKGLQTSITKPFNESLLLLYIASVLYPDQYKNALDYWKNPANMPKSYCSDFELLTDRQDGSSLSSFPSQLVFYTVPFFREIYPDYFANQLEADYLSSQKTGRPEYFYGHGAGSAPSEASGKGYSVQNLCEEFNIISIMNLASFMPLGKGKISDHMLDNFRNGAGKYEIGEREYLYRFMPENPSWIPNELVGIDMFYALLGYAFYFQGDAFLDLFEFKGIEAMPQIGEISGKTNACSNTEVTYAVNNVQGLTYQWELPEGWEVIGAPDNEVRVKTGNKGGTIRVEAANEIGIKVQQELVVSVVPALPNFEISGPSIVSQGETTKYSVTQIPGVQYSWSFEGQLISTDASIELNPNKGGTLKVEISNNCETVNVSKSISVKAQDELHLSIDNVEAYAGDVVQIPVYISSVTLDAFQFTLKYSSSLTLKDIIWNGSIEEAKIVSNNNASEGWIAVAYAGEEIKLDNNAKFFDLIFEIDQIGNNNTLPISFATTPTAPEFSHSSMVYSLALNNGMIKVLAGSDAEIQLKYHKSLIPIADTKIELYEESNLVTDAFTNQNGQVVFENLTNHQYSIHPVIEMPYGGVSSIDLLLMLRQIVGLNMNNEFDELTLKAADVTNDGKLSISDVSLVAKRIVGLVDKYSIDDFIFDDLNLTVDSRNISKTINMLAAADVNASYFNSSLKSQNNFCTGNETVKVEQNSTIRVPISLSESTDSISALDLCFAFDSDVLKFQELEIEDSSNLVYSYQNDTIHLVWASVKPLQVQQYEPFIFLDFEVLDTEKLFHENIQLTLIKSELADINAQQLEFDFCYDIIRQTTNLRNTFENNQIKLYPNPVRSRFQIDSNSTIHRVCIYNSMGDRINCCSNINEKQFKFNALQWHTGIYIIEITTSKDKEIIKVIKQ